MRDVTHIPTQSSFLLCTALACESSCTVALLNIEPLGSKIVGEISWKLQSDLRYRSAISSVFSQVFPLQMRAAILSNATAQGLDDAAAQLTQACNARGRTWSILSIVLAVRSTASRQTQS
jgi:hypothetical protein